MEGARVGAAEAWLPMVTCGDPCAAPTGFPLTNRWNTVECGISWWDIFIGATGIIAGMAMEIFIGGGFKRGAFKQAARDLRFALLRVMPHRFSDRITKALGKELLKELLIKKILKEENFKKSGESLTGLLTSGLRLNP